MLSISADELTGLNMAELTREQLLMSIIAGRGPAYLRGVDLSTLNLANAGWLCEADLRQANLSGSNLSRANLKDANLEKANLHDSNLTGTVLEGANLRDIKGNAAIAKMANLRGADLKSARLVGVNLFKANLESANLEGVDLEGANLEGAELANARLDLANLKMANLRGANMEGASVTGTILDKDDIAEIIQTPSSGFAGSMQNMRLTDMVQMASLSRSTMLIRVHSLHSQGIIHVKSGKIRHAQTGNIQGEPALLQMLCWESGRFETLPLPKSEMETVDKPLEHLIIEAMRLRDEKKTRELRKSSGRVVD